MGATWSVTSLADILDPVADSIERGNDRLTDIARQESGTVLGTMLNFAIDANGKRVRPALVFLATELFGKVDDGAVDLAAATECLHSATLVHDDIVDGADSRRGREAVHVNWSEGAAVLTGDYLFAAAAGLVGGLDMPRIMTLFAETIMQISRSEFDEPTYGPDGELMMGDYVAKIEGKTASSSVVLAGPADDVMGQSLQRPQVRIVRKARQTIPGLLAKPLGVGAGAGHRPRLAKLVQSLMQPLPSGSAVTVETSHRGLVRSSGL